MKTIYLVRHALSQANVDGIVAGSEFESPLTRIGKDQAKKTGKKLRSKNIQLIVSSPMERAKKTAEIIAKEVDYDNKKILYNKLLTERAYGSFSGTPFEHFKKHVDENNLPEEIESVERLHKRASKIVEWLKQLKQTEIVVVSHGSTGRMIKVVAGELDHSHFHTIERIGNAEIYEFTLE